MGTKVLIEMQQQLRHAMSSSGNTPTSAKKLEDTMDIYNSIFLVFEDITYNARPWILSKRKAELLKNVSGEFRAGELTAIMGLSGAGKSTLMDVLAGFTTAGVTGNIMVNSKARNVNEFRRLSAYIMQNDNLQPLLTVQEAMNIAAELKLTASHQERKQKLVYGRTGTQGHWGADPLTPLENLIVCFLLLNLIYLIDQILVTMNLDSCRHTRTGQLSGGERKRLAIALELINSPPIMFLDEPTSGLDSVTSKYCITLLKQLTKAGQTVICSIHQPSASLLNMIDHLYVVADGNCVYSGSTQNLVPYLSSLGLQCPTHYNPADYRKYVPELVNAIENGKNNAWRSTSNVTNVNHQEEVIALNVTASFQALRQRSPMEIEHVHSKHKGSGDYAASFWKQLVILLKRNAIRLSRDKVLTFTRLSMHFIIALLVGVLYFKVVPSELPIIMREHFNRWYKLHSFYLANKLADIPIQFVAISLYILIVYYMSDQLLELQRFCLYTLMCFAVSMVAQTFGLLIGTGMKIQVTEIAESLNLTNCLDTLVENLSGGERKRLSIGIEIITKPSVLLFDEPTSGLDSTSSNQVIGLLHKIAKGGCTVACAIHQPSSRMISQFDDLLVLHNGTSFYYGPWDDVFCTFSDAGYTCPQFYNISEFVLEVITGERSGDLNNLYKISRDKYSKSKKHLQYSIMGTEDTVAPKLNNITSKSGQTVWQEQKILFLKAIICIKRDNTLTKLRFAAHVIVAFLLGIVFYDSGNNAIPVEAAVFLREYLSNWYRLRSYFSVKVFSDLPLQILAPTVFITITYYMTGQPMEHNRFFRTWLICILTTILGQSSGMLIGVAFNTHLGTFLIPAINMPMILFAGFFLKFSEVTPYLQPLCAVSFFRYAFEGILQAIYDGNRERLQCYEIYCHVRLPKKILEGMDMPAVSFCTTVISLCIWILCLQLLTYLILKWKARNTKR
ncbi:ATP-binding cassette sub-family G member 1 [Eufriesea mexicana]|nr:ATP-binding cassette sub-family G member 1 [Eufriesea mexicana]